MKIIFMGKIILIMFLMMYAVLASAQVNNPVKWNYTVVKIADKTYELHLTAAIENNWRMYAQDAGKGPEPTTIRFITNPLVSFDGKLKALGKLEKYYDKHFKSVAKYYGNNVVFVQKVKTRSSIATVVKGTINYMVCSDRKCLPPREVPFSIHVGG